MVVPVSDRAKTRVTLAANAAFLEHGYAALTMIDLAKHCGLSRRGLYNHFKSKDEVFRASISLRNAMAVANGDNAGTEALNRGGSAVDVISAWLDARFGQTRRAIGLTPHGKELNDAAFRVAMDIMIEVSYFSNRKLSELITDLCTRGLLVLRQGFTADRVGRLLGDGARGVNQARPPIPNDEIAGRYRDLVEVILFGCAAPNAAASPAPVSDTDQPATPQQKSRKSSRR